VLNAPKPDGDGARLAGRRALARNGAMRPAHHLGMPFREAHFVIYNLLVKVAGARPILTSGRRRASAWTFIAGEIALAHGETIGVNPTAKQAKTSANRGSKLPQVRSRVRREPP